MLKALLLHPGSQLDVGSTKLADLVVKGEGHKAGDGGDHLGGWWCGDNLRSHHDTRHRLVAEALLQRQAVDAAAGNADVPGERWVVKGELVFSIEANDACDSISAVLASDNPHVFAGHDRRLIMLMSPERRGRRGTAMEGQQPARPQQHGPWSALLGPGC